MLTSRPAKRVDVLRAGEASVLTGALCRRERSLLQSALSEALEQIDEQVYEPHEHVEDDLEDLHDDVGRVVESARPAEHERQDRYHDDN
jgi:hypothetical protein